MDLTPKQLIEDVEFREVRRGYDPAEVDAFLDRVAAAMGKLQAQLTEALARAQAAEANQGPAVAVAPVSSADVATTEQLQRTLILAQRTADAAVQEAQEEAAALRAGAAADAERVLGEARDEAERHAQSAREASLAELRDYDIVRSALLTDLALLEAHTEAQRASLRESIGALQRVLDDPAVLRTAPVEGMSDAHLPTLAVPVVETATADPAPDSDVAEQGEAAIDSEAEAPLADDVAADVADGDEPEPESGVEDAPQTDDQPPAEQEAVADPEPAADPAPEAEAEQVVIDLPAAETVAAGDAPAEAEDDAWDTFVKSERHEAPAELEFDEPLGRVDGPPPAAPDSEAVEVAVPDDGPPTEAIDLAATAAPTVDDSDDAFLAELRKAMTDEEPLGPRDENEQLDSFPIDDRSVEGRPRPRFGRRR